MTLNACDNQDLERDFQIKTYGCAVLKVKVKVISEEQLHVSIVARVLASQLYLPQNVRVYFVIPIPIKPFVYDYIDHSV